MSVANKVTNTVANNTEKAEDKVVKYIVVEANNLDSDILVQSLHANLEDAQDMLGVVYKELLNTIEPEEIEEIHYAKNIYKVFLTNGDYYYGNVRPLIIDKEELLWNK